MFIYILSYSLFKDTSSHEHFSDFNQSPQLHKVSSVVLQAKNYSRRALRETTIK